jgi:hypothetical protein
MYSLGALTRATHGPPTPAELVRSDIATLESISKWQRSKQAHPRSPERHALGQLSALTVTSAELIEYVRSRKGLP